MPKLKVTDDQMDVDAMEEAEWNEDQEEFAPYDGPIPPAGTRVPGFLKMWMTFDSNDNRMIKVLFVGDDNAGKYENIPIWDNLSMIPTTKFKWQPLFNVIGITPRDVKSKTTIGDQENPRFGIPITKIANFRPGEEHDEAYLTAVTKIGYDQNGEKRAEIRTWLPYDAWEGSDNGSGPDDEYEEPEDADVDTDEEEYEEEEPEEEPEIEEEEPEPAPARGRGRAAKPAATGRSRAAKPAAKAAGPSGRGGRAGAARATTATRGGKGSSPARSGRGGRGGSKDEPPF